MKPELLFAGDTHGSLRHLEQLPTECDGVPIIHLGDAAPLGGRIADALSAQIRERFWFIPGNHDHDREEYRQQLLHGGLEHRNLHGRVAQVGNFRIAGLGNVFNQRVWHPDLGEPKYQSLETFRQALPVDDRERISTQVAEAIWWEEYEALASLEADILVTHEAPSCHKNGFAVIDELAAFMGCSLIVHGHHHEYYTASVNEGATQVIGVGLRGVTDQTGNRIVHGDLDEARAGRWRGM
jgi:predicted phosphodiesterase